MAATLTPEPQASTRAAAIPRAGAPSRRGLTIRSAWALTVAAARYWTLLAPYVHEHVEHWQARAREIEDVELRSLALEKLTAERFNAEAAAMIATAAPAAHRRAAVRAIVALELMYDYLDGLTERPLADPIGEGEALYAIFVTAVEANATAPAARPAQGEAGSAQGEARTAQEAQGGATRPTHGAEGYLRELANAAREAIAELPAHEAITPCARRCAQMGARAQVLMHATPQIGTADLEQWARSEAQQSTLPWRELLAGAACSVLAIHALIAAAADPSTTEAQARRIETAYLPSCALMTLLDGVIDTQHDTTAGRLGYTYTSLYETPELLGEALARCARQARSACEQLPDGAHHATMLAGAVAYWISAPGARGEGAKAVLAGMRRELGGLLTPPLLLMRAWRAAKRMRAGRYSSD